MFPISRYHFFSVLIIWLLGISVSAAQQPDSLLSLARQLKVQNELAGSLKYYLQSLQRLEKNADSSQTAQVCTEIGLVYQDGKLYEKAIEYFQRAYSIYNPVRNQAESIALMQNIALAYTQLGKYNSALLYYLKILETTDNQVSTDKKLRLLRQIVDCYNHLDNANKSLEYNQQILQIYDKQKDKNGMAITLNNIGYNYKYLKKYEKAIEFFGKALSLQNTVGRSEAETAPILVNIGIAYQNLGDYKNALAYIQKATKIVENKGNKAEIAKIYDLLAVLYLNIKDDHNARYYNELSKSLAVQQKEPEILQAGYQTSSMIAQANEEYEEALDFYKKYLNIRDSISLEERARQQELVRQNLEVERTEKELKLLLANEEVKDLMMKQLQLDAEKRQRDFELLQKENMLKDATLRQQQTEREKALQALLLAQKEAQNIRNQQELALLEKQRTEQELELKNKEIAEKEKEQEINDLVRNRELQNLKINQKEAQIAKEQEVQRYLVGLVGLGALVAVTILIGLINTRRINQKLARQKEEIQLKNAELEQNKEEIKSQRDAISQKNDELNVLYTNVKASITYAQRIQAAMLPPIEKIKAIFPESFILFKPRDIVSGDFYWLEKFDNKVIIAAVDCTGHGVPGAFMSLIGNDLLNEIVVAREITEADQILNELHKGVTKALRQNQTHNRDGMDMSLCILHQNPENQKFTHFDYAGAKNPMIYVQNGEITQLKANKMPIGGEQKERQRIFEKETVMLNASTELYLFSDGYQDQFGGADGRKFMIKQLRELIGQIHTQPLERQGHIFDETMNNWIKQARTHQIDDILLMGFRISL